MEIAEIILVNTCFLAAWILIGAFVLPKTKSTRLSEIKMRNVPDPPKTFKELTLELSSKRERAEADLKIAIARNTISEIYELMAKKSPNEKTRPTQKRPGPPPAPTVRTCCSQKRPNTTSTSRSLFDKVPKPGQNRAVCGTCLEAIGCKCAEKVFVNWPEVDERINKAISLAQEAIEIAQRGGHPERINFEFNYRK